MVPWVGKINDTMVFLNNFLLRRRIHKPFGAVVAYMSPILWFKDELLTPNSVRERLVLVSLA